MARLPSQMFLMQQIEGMVVLFHEDSEEEIVRYNPSDDAATMQALHTIHETTLLSEEDKYFAHFWAGYFYAHAA